MSTPRIEATPAAGPKAPWEMSFADFGRFAHCGGDTALRRRVYADIIERALKAGHVVPAANIEEATKPC